MAQYCVCSTCQNSPAQPNELILGNPEIVSGSPVFLAPGDTLVHWSGGRFSSILSTEIADIQATGTKMVCASFYLYRSGTPLPTRCPGSLTSFGLAGQYRYTIDNSIGNIPIFLKSNTPANPAEVVVILGCGGSLSYAGTGGTGVSGSESATGSTTFYSVATPPTNNRTSWQKFKKSVGF